MGLTLFASSIFGTTESGLPS
jgi:hypothetical protein